MPCRNACWLDVQGVISQGMTPDIEELGQMARAREDENYRFRAFLKHHPRLSSTT